MKAFVLALFTLLFVNSAFASGVAKIGCRTADFLVRLAYPIGEVENISGDIRNLSTNSEFKIDGIIVLNDVAHFEADPNGQGIKIFSVRDLFAKPVLEISIKDESGASQVIETLNCSLANAHG